MPDHLGMNLQSPKFMKSNTSKRGWMGLFQHVKRSSVKVHCPLSLALARTFQLGVVVLASHMALSATT
jgi:hypothetical protein